MSRFAPVAGLALHELWISFRLLLVVGLLLLASLPAALVPRSIGPGLEGAPPDSLGWYAIALAAAMTAVGGVAAATIARERRRGSAGWMVARAVPRTTILLAWMSAFGLLLVGGLAAAGLVGWLSLEATLPPTAALPFVTAIASAACAGAAGLALGALAGALLSPIPAALATMLLAGPPLLGAASLQWKIAGIPSAGLAVLADLETATRPVADALLAAGTALLLTAALLVAAAAAFERAEL